MAITLYEMRQKAPTAALATAFDTVIRTEPLLAEVMWDACTGDEYPYRRARNAATAAYFNSDSTLTDGTDESFDRIVAHIRPIAGQIQTPVIGSASGSIVDHVKAKTRAVVYTFMENLINGGFGVATAADCDALTGGAAGATGSIIPGPYWDLSARGDHASVKAVVVNGVSVNLSIRRAGDTAYGTASGVLALGGGDSNVVLKSANPNYWLDCYYDISDFTDRATGTYEFDVLITSTTNESDGLIKLVSETDSYIDTPSAAAEAFDLGHLDLLAQECSSGGRKFYFMSERTARSFLAEMRGLGGVSYTEVAGQKRPEYNGIPVLTSTYMPITRTYAGTGNCAPIFMIDVDEGLRCIFRSGNGSTEWDGKSWGGLRVSNLGEIVTNAENELYRITAHWGVAHLNLPGIVMLDGITN